ncbi:MAG: transposase [Candidatus Bathyarchaeia archaeon]
MEEGEMRRTLTLRLLPDRNAENKLKLLCSLSAKLWNEVSYVRRRMFFEEKKVDLKSTYKEFYEKYKILIGSATTQQILNKNNEAWKSFFSLLKAKKEGKLPPFIRNLNPPIYRKKSGSRELWCVLRKDQYRFDGNCIVIKGLGAIGSIRVRYIGRINVRGKQGRAEIRYDSDEKKWYIHVAFEVSEKIAKDEWVEVPVNPLGDKVAGIDIGINNLLAVYAEDGSALIVSGRLLKSISFYWRKKIANYQSTLNKYGLKSSRKLRKMYKKWRKQVKSCINWAVRNTVEWLYWRGVSRVLVGYPKHIAQNGDKNSKVNFEVVHAWTYGYLLRRLIELGKEYGIRVELVSEENTSTTCPLCKAKSRDHRRVCRGLLKCYKHNKVFNADLAGAYNILLRGEENILLKAKTIPPSPALCGVGVIRLRPGVGLNPAKAGEVALNLPRTLAL